MNPTLTNTGMTPFQKAVQSGTYAEQQKIMNTANPVSNTIVASDVATPSPMAVTNPKPATGLSGVQGLIDGHLHASQAEIEAQDATKALEEKAKIDATAKSTSQQTLVDKLLGRKGKAELTNEAYSDDNNGLGSVNTAQVELKNINNQLISEQTSARHEIESLKNTFHGTEAGYADAVNNIKSRSLSRQADLAVIQLAAQGKYDSAREIADRVIEAQSEKEQNEIDAANLTYQDNKDQFTKSEQRAFESEQADRQRKLDEEKTAKKTLSDTKLQVLKSASEQGAPMSVKTAIQKATTPEEAVTAAGQYAGDILERQIKQAQLSKLNEEIKSLKAPLITNPEAGQYAGALSVILGSGTFTKEQKNSVIAAINNGQDPFTVVKNQAKNILGTQGTELTKLEAAKNSMETLDNLIKNFYASGGDSGIFKGNFEKVANKLGTVNNPELVGIAAQIASSLQKYRNNISGTAYSEQEGRDIAAIFPGITKGEILNNTIIKARLNSLDSDIDGLYRSALGNTYDSLKASQPSTKTPNIVTAPDGQQVEITD